MIGEKKLYIHTHREWTVSIVTAAYFKPLVSNNSILI